MDRQSQRVRESENQDIRDFPVVPQKYPGLFNAHRVSQRDRIGVYYNDYRHMHTDICIFLSGRLTVVA